MCFFGCIITMIACLTFGCLTSKQHQILRCHYTAKRHSQSLWKWKNSLVQHKIEVKPSIARGPSLPAFIALSSTAADPQDKHHKQAYKQPVTSTPVHGHYSSLVTAALHKSMALPSKPSKQDIQLWWR